MRKRQLLSLALAGLMVLQNPAIALAEDGLLLVEEDVDLDTAENAEEQEEDVVDASGSESVSTVVEAETEDFIGLIEDSGDVESAEYADDNMVSITLDADGGNFWNNQEQYVQDFQNGEQIDLWTLQTPEKEGYVCIGWSEVPQAAIPTILPNWHSEGFDMSGQTPYPTYTVESAKTLYAVWAKTKKVIFHGAGINLSTVGNCQTVEGGDWRGETIIGAYASWEQVETPNSAVDGKRIIGWKKNLTDSAYYLYIEDGHFNWPMGNEIDDDLELFAVYKDDQDYIAGSWGQGEGGQTDADFTFTYHANGGTFSNGTGINSIGYSEKQEIYPGNMELPTLDGYVCIGWAEAKDATEPSILINWHSPAYSYENTPSVLASENKDLYAIWANGTTVNFHGNGISLSTVGNSQVYVDDQNVVGTYSYTEQVEAPNSAENGKRVIGWKVSQDADNYFLDFSDGFDWPKGEDIVEISDLYAVWEEDPSYDANNPWGGQGEGGGDYEKGDLIHLTFDANGGYFEQEEAPNTEQVTIETYQGDWEEDSPIPMSQDDNSVFVGWAYDSEAEIPDVNTTEYNVYTDDEGIWPEEDDVLYAIWSTPTTITFDGNGENLYFDEDAAGESSLTWSLLEAETISGWNAPRVETDDLKVGAWSTDQEGNNIVIDYYSEDRLLTVKELKELGVDKLYAQYKAKVYLDGNGGSFDQSDFDTEDESISYDTNGYFFWIPMYHTAHNFLHEIAVFPRISRVAFIGWEVTDTEGVSKNVKLYNWMGNAGQDENYEVPGYHIQRGDRLKAMWATGHSSTVTFHEDSTDPNSEILAVMTIETGNEYSFEQQEGYLPERADKAFVGWTDTVGGSAITKYDFAFQVDQDIDLYAVWTTDIVKVTFKLDPNRTFWFIKHDQDEYTRSVNVKKNSTASFYHYQPVGDDNDETILGWYDQNLNYYDFTTSDGEFTVGTANITFTPKYGTLSNVTIDPDGAEVTAWDGEKITGTFVTEVYRDANGEFPETELQAYKFKKDGYVFKGFASKSTNGEWVLINGFDRDYTGNLAWTSSNSLKIVWEPVNQPKPQHTHSFGAWTVTRQATALQAGVETRTCACGQKEERAIEKLKATIQLNATSAPLKFGQKTSALKVTLAAGDSVVSWTSNNTAIATVDASGVITAGKKAGTATITVRTKAGAVATFDVKVQKAAVKATQIAGLNSKETLKAGAKLQLAPVVYPITVTGTAKFSSSNKKVATVDKNGVITAKKAGTAKIKVKVGNKTFTVKVTVPKPVINNVPATVTLKVGQTLQLNPSVDPVSLNGKVKYSSSKKSVAKVSKIGVITTKKAGKATITLNVNGTKKKVKVTVVK